MIIYFLGLNVKEYRSVYIRQILAGKLPLTCCECGGDKLRLYDWVERRSWESEAHERIRIARFFCPQCRKLHRLLPDFLPRFGHYTQQTRLTAMQARLEEGQPWEKVAEVSGASLATVKRWLQRGQERVCAAARLLYSLLLRAFPQRINEHLAFAPPRGASPLTQLKAACSGWQAKAKQLVFSNFLGLSNIIFQVCQEQLRL